MHRISAAFAVIVLFAACDEDNTPLATEDPTCDRFEVTRSVDYASGQFFRLTAPVAFYFTDTDSFPVALQDSSLAIVQSEHNPGAPWRIDYASLEIYRTVGPGPSQAGTIDDAVAYLDATGIGFEGFGAGANLTPGDSGPTSGSRFDSGFDPAIALNVPQQYRERWERLREPEEWFPLEDNGQFIGIQLSRPAIDSEIIACSYNIVDAVTGELVRRVGRSSEDGEDGRIEDPVNPGRRINYFKLLKPGAPVAQPFASGAYTEFALCWEYEYRNVYSLQGTDLFFEHLEFAIVSTDRTLDPPDRMPEEVDRLQTPFVQVFGLDRWTRSGASVPDGVADVENQNLFNLNAGYVRFPHPTPMDLPDDVVAEYTGGVVTGLPLSMRATTLYTRRLTHAERASVHHFNFEVRWRE